MAFCRSRTSWRKFLKSSAGLRSALRQLWSLTWRETQVQTFADAFLVIALCLAIATMLAMSIERQRTEGPGMRGVFTGAHAVNPFTGQRVPVYLAALSPKMLELTGELAYGWLGTSFVPEGADADLRPFGRHALAEEQDHDERHRRYEWHEPRVIEEEHRVSPSAFRRRRGRRCASCGR